MPVRESGVEEQGEMMPSIVPAGSVDRSEGGCNEYVGLDRGYVSLMRTLIATKLIRKEVIEYTECKKYRDGVSGTTRSRGDYRFE